MNATTKIYLPALIAIAAIVAAVAFIFIAPAKASAHALFGGGAGSSLSININNAGNVSVNGAKVTSVSGATISATTILGNSSLNWTVVTGSSTSYSPKNGGVTAPSLADVKVGDYIAFSGPIDQNASAITVDAKAIKDYSFFPILNGNGNLTLSGSVASVNLGGNALVLSTKGQGNVNISLASSTLLVKDGAAVLLSNLAVGNTVAVKGTYTVSTNTLLAEKIIVNGEIKDSNAQNDNQDNGKDKGDKETKFQSFWNGLKDRFNFHLNSH